MTPDQFLDAMAECCRFVRIKTKPIGGKAYLMDVQLSALLVPRGRDVP